GQIRALIYAQRLNNPAGQQGRPASPALQARMDREQQRHRVYAEAIKKLRSDPRYKSKSFYAYLGGSGKKLTQEMIGPAFIRTLLDSGCRIALERYLHEMSSEKGSKDALQTFIDGIAD